MSRGRPKGAKDKQPRKRAASPVKIAEQVADQRSHVELLASEGLTDIQIAQAMRIDVDVLRARFAAELENADPLVRARVLMRLNEQSAGGNVSATKTLEEITRHRMAEKRITEPEQPDMISPRGKKEQRLFDAQTAGRGTDWGDDLETPQTAH